MSEITARDVLRIVLGSGQPHLVLCVSAVASSKEVLRAAERMRAAAKQTATDTQGIRDAIDLAELRMLRKDLRSRPKPVRSKRYPNLKGFVL